MSFSFPLAASPQHTVVVFLLTYFCLSRRKDIFRLFKVNLCSWSSHVLRPPGPRFSVNRSTVCTYSTPFSACRCGHGSHTKRVLNHLSPSLSSVIFPFLRTSWKASIAAVRWWLFPMPANTFDFLNFKFQTYRKVTRIYNWHPHTPYQVHQLWIFCHIFFLSMLYLLPLFLFLLNHLRVLQT